MTDAPLPMLATLGPPPAGTGWAYEMKWDGQRAIAVVDSASASLVSRNANDVSGSFPELIDALPEAVAGHPVVLDGEIVAMDDKGQIETSTPPFAQTPPRAIAKDAHWVTPKYVGDVEYREFTGKLRHPSWKGLRDDKSPADVDWPGDH